MVTIHIVRVALTCRIRIALEFLERQLVASPRTVGERLETQVRAYVEANRLGYFPPLDFFRKHGGIDPDLLKAADNIAWLVTTTIRQEIRRRLNHIFSNVRVESVQSLAFTMPAVRPHQANARDALIKHFTPNAAKAVLVLSMISKQQANQLTERMARQRVLRLLGRHFEALDVTSAHVL